MSELSSTYASALFELSSESGEVEQTLSRCGELQTILAENEDLIKFLSTPTVPKTEKIRVVDSIFRGSFSGDFLNFIKVMISRGNALELTASLRDFEDLYNKKNNIEKATAITAVPMSEAAVTRLTEKLEAMTGKKIILTNRVSESCLGGVILDFSEFELDDSIASKLEDLKNKLKSAE